MNNPRQCISHRICAHKLVVLDLFIMFTLSVSQFRVIDVFMLFRVASYDQTYYHQWSNPGPWFNIKMPSYQYRKSHCGDKTVVRSSYLHNGISYTGKMASLYWFTPLNDMGRIGRTKKTHTQHSMNRVYMHISCWRYLHVRRSNMLSTCG